MEFIKLLYPFGIFIIAFAVSFISTMPALHTAVAVGAVDIPRDGRRMHTRPIPRGGGIAIFSAFAVAVLFYAKGQISPLSGAMLSGGAIMTALGFCDDVYPLPPYVKLIGEGSISAIPLAFGVYASGISLFGERIALPFILSVLLSFLWVVGISNAMNLIDGLDGLAAGVAFIVSVTLCIRGALGGDTEVTMLAIALSGAAFGFLPHNGRKAKIFMGDCGSLTLGYFLAVLTLAGNASAAKIASDSAAGGGYFPFAAALLMLAYPITDMLAAVIRRTKNGTGIFCADKKHIHHRLCDRGLSHARAVFLLLSLTAATCALSLLL